MRTWWPDALVAPPAAVEGVVGTSEDGNNVYFVADGVLVGARSEWRVPRRPAKPLSAAERRRGTGFHREHSQKMVRKWNRSHLSRGESEGEYGDWQPGLANRTAEVSPDGGGVVFMSSLSLPVVGHPKVIHGGRRGQCVRV